MPNVVQGEQIVDEPDGAYGNLLKINLNHPFCRVIRKLNWTIDQ